MKVTIGQINTTNGDIEGNVAKIMAAIEKAKADGSDMIVFPEVVTHGYTSLDWFQDRDIIENALEPLERIIPATAGHHGRCRHDSPESGSGRKAPDIIPRPSFTTAKLLGFADKTSCPNTTFSTIRAISSRRSTKEFSRSTALKDRRRRLRRFLERQDFLERKTLRR